MKNQKQKRKSKTPNPTEEELKKLLLNAGFVIASNKKSSAFGKPAKDLNQGETLIFPEGANKGIPVK
jgi:hypothetical protein